MKGSYTYQFRKLSIVTLFVTLLLNLTACSTVQIGRDFDVQLFNSMVKPHESTKSQVQGWLGSPSGIGASVDKDGESSEEWMYFFGAGELPKMANTQIKILQVRFNKNGVVRSYNWSNSK